MIRFLRTSSTKGLIAAGLASVGLLAGGAMIATGAASSGSKPVPKPLAQAIAGSLAGKEAFTGVSARVVFTNRLLDSSGLAAGTDPLAGGGSGRLWVDPDGRFRIELQSEGGGGDVQLVSDGKDVWLSHGASGNAWKATLPDHSGEKQPKAKDPSEWPPGVANVTKAIRSLAGDASISAAAPDNVGGRPAYTVKVTPKDTSGLLAGAKVSWDAATGAPLAISVLAKGQDEPVLDIRATEVETGPVDDSVFEVEAPAGAKDVDLNAMVATAKAEARARKTKYEGKRPVTGLRAVQGKVGFRITAPEAVGSRKLSGAVLLGEGKEAGVALSYGTGLGAIAVIQLPEARAKDEPKSDGWDHGDGGSLPTTSIGGVEATVLRTALGSMASFTRSGISFTVIGSVTGDELVAAARQLS